MAPSIETGQTPALPPLQRGALKLASALTTPAHPGDYLALLDQRWASREAVAAVETIRPESKRAATIVLRPETPWPGHLAGQYVRLGVEINGVRHWRAYSITSDPQHPLGLVSITVQQVEGGLVSTELLQHSAPGRRLYLGHVEGEFVVPPVTPAKMLMISAGSGVTPIMSMVRELERRGALKDVIHLHCSRTSDDAIFADLLGEIAERHPGYDVRQRFSSAEGRLTAAELDTLVPDWRQRTAFLSGPTEMIDDLEAHWASEGIAEQLSVEHFRPTIGLGNADAEGGGSITFRVSGYTAEAEPGVSILVAAERAGGQLPHGCRMGICHSCIGQLQSGQVRDLRTGDIHGESGQAIRTCVNAPAGDIEIDL